VTIIDAVTFVPVAELEELERIQAREVPHFRGVQNVVIRRFSAVSVSVVGEMLQA
jgi:hypothetical protein